MWYTDSNFVHLDRLKSSVLISTLSKLQKRRHGLDLCAECNRLTRANSRFKTFMNYQTHVLLKMHAYFHLYTALILCLYHRLDLVKNSFKGYVLGKKI